MFCFLLLSTLVSTYKNQPHSTTHVLYRYNSRLVESVWEGREGGEGREGEPQTDGEDMLG